MKKGSICMLSASLLALSLVFVGYVKGKNEVEEVNHALKVEVTKPLTESIFQESAFTETIESAQEVTVTPKKSGTVIEKYFDVGDSVNAGDLLFVLQDEAAQKIVKQAQVTLNTARVNYESSKASFEAQVASANVAVGTIASQEMQLENAIESAENTLEDAVEARKLAEESTEYKKQQLVVLDGEYKEIQDSLEDYEYSEGNYSELIDEYKRIQGYADASDWESFYANTGKDYNNDTDPSDVTAAIEESVDDTLGNLQIKYTEASLNVENTKDAIAKLETAKDAADLDVDSSLNSEKAAGNIVESAKRGVNLAQVNWSQYQNHTKKTITTGTQSALAEARVGLAGAQGILSNAQSSVDNAKLQLDDIKTTAPVAGEITEINITKHNMAASGSPAYVILPKDGNNITFYVSEKIMENLSDGQELRLERNGVLYKATISSISDVVDASNGLFQVKAMIQGDTSNLTEGSSVKLTIVTEKAESVMALPIDSVYYDNQVSYVFCVIDGKAVKTDIKTGLANEDVVQVVSGIDSDSQIIVSRSSDLSDGATVVISEPATSQEAE